MSKQILSTKFCPYGTSPAGRQCSKPLIFVIYQPKADPPWAGIL